MSITPADRLRSKKARRITVGIYLDETLADRLDAAVMALHEIALHEARGLNAADQAVEALEAAKDQAQADLDEATMWFTFQGIGRKAFARLLDEHPATDEQIAEAEAKGWVAPEFNSSTFPIPLLTAACLAPTLTVKDFQAVYASDAWNDAERGALFAAAMSVCTQARPLQVRASP